MTDSLTTDQALIAIQLNQHLAEFAHELDVNKGANIGKLYAEDGAFLVGNFAYRGRDAIEGFYRNRPVPIDAEKAGAVRTGRHIYVNQRAEIADADNATLYFICVHYAASGTPPIPGLTGPVVVADCRMIFRREGGNWRIVEFSSAPIFLGNDAGLNKLLVKTA